MEHYKARELTFWDEQDVWDLALTYNATTFEYEFEVGARCTVEFDDGVTKEMAVCDMVISWYFWQLISYYPEIQLSSKLSIDGRLLTDDLSLKLTYEAIRPTKTMDIDKTDVWYLAQNRILGDLFNAIAARLLPFATSTSYLDVNDLNEEPRIKAANAAVTSSQDSIDNVYKVIGEVFAEDKWLCNPIVRAIRYGTVQLPQINQSIGPVGRKTDIDSEIFLEPIKEGFSHGFRTNSSFIKETRTAAKSLLMTKDPVKHAEFFNRKLRLVCSVIEDCIPGDCGSEAVIDFYITDKNALNSIVGLQIVVGEKRYVLEAPDLTLIHKTVGVRTTLSCRHLPNQQVCEACYGESSYALVKGTNPGYVSCTAIAERISNLIISTKHLDFIQHVFTLMVRNDGVDTLSSKDIHSEVFYLNDANIGKRLHMQVSAKEVPNIVDISYITNIAGMDGHSLAKISSIKSCVFFNLDDNGRGVNYKDIDMMQADLGAVLSIEALTFIKETGYEVDLNNTCTFDLSEWDFSLPFFIYPLKHANMAEYRSKLEFFIRSNKDDEIDEDDATTQTSTKSKKQYRGKRLRDYNREADGVSKAMQDAHSLIAQKLKNVHLGHVATILAATRVADGRINEWGMPGHINDGVFRAHDELISMRSLSVKMVYMGQIRSFLSPSSYLVSKRPHSILDTVLHISPAQR